ncbi:hypothetical protein ROZALSC1DRAFT_29605 [Rozella allomycis CSF55]|uniref:Uncharacterized protein n=1 Tax=Rozella allomycis (strain CSF55) TaxID=988480 RepID=A0A075AU61_ROZAC|nr:hypothetical protein O9G_003526 [Rozella allomycis CSF55]RKP18735.1 hypothetical protein ROZALSC1DRAFT_29605 [Rozella allomycis CSF55]|eukprot:EPZ32062.1 hypothetical protein O9G_003526 [Rozella allomycis CSF55]
MQIFAQAPASLQDTQSHPFQKDFDRMFQHVLIEELNDMKHIFQDESKGSETELELRAVESFNKVVEILKPSSFTDIYLLKILINAENLVRAAIKIILLNPELIDRLDEKSLKVIKDYLNNNEEFCEQLEFHDRWILYNLKVNYFGFFHFDHIKPNESILLISSEHQRCAINGNRASAKRD